MPVYARRTDTGIAIDLLLPRGWRPPIMYRYRVRMHSFCIHMIVRIAELRESVVRVVDTHEKRTKFMQIIFIGLTALFAWLKSYFLFCNWIFCCKQSSPSLFCLLLRALWHLKCDVKGNCRQLNEPRTVCRHIRHWLLSLHHQPRHPFQFCRKKKLCIKQLNLRCCYSVRPNTCFWPERMGAYCGFGYGVICICTIDLGAWPVH